MRVQLIGHYGTERLICEQAGLSTGKEPKDIEGMIRRLLSWKHMKPFEICSLHFEVTIPIWLDRQLVTYRTLVGSVANSGRYGSTIPDFHVPEEVLGLPEEEDYRQVLNLTYHFYKDMVEKYQNSFPEKHRAREIFRGLLPQSQYTTRRFQINLRNFLHVVEERTGPRAQKEIRQIVAEMRKLAGPLFPTVLT